LKRGHRKKRGHDPDAMAASEFYRSISVGGFLGRDRQTFQMPPHVFAELLHRAVTAGWVLVKGLEKNLVQIAFQAPALSR